MDRVNATIITGSVGFAGSFIGLLIYSLLSGRPINAHDAIGRAFFWAMGAAITRWIYF